MIVYADSPQQSFFELASTQRQLDRPKRMYEERKKTYEMKACVYTKEKDKEFFLLTPAYENKIRLNPSSAELGTAQPQLVLL